MEIKSRIANRIRHLREERKLTQEQLAWKSEVNRTFMNHVESGRKNISIETLNKILNALEISLRDFVGEQVFENWITESSWKEYFYLNMCMLVYLYCDQPNTCPLCGSRADLIFEYGVLLRYASINQCFDKNCGYIFIMEADWEEMKEAIAIIKGKGKHISV